MNIRRITISGIAAVASIAALAGGGMARADAPSPGDPCPVMNATTTDAAGKTMWCNPMMTGTHGLVWQYGGPA